MIIPSVVSNFCLLSNSKLDRKDSMGPHNNNRFILVLCFNFFWLFYGSSCLETKNSYSSVELTSLGPALDRINEISEGSGNSSNDTLAIDVKMNLGDAQYMTSTLKSLFLNPKSTSAQSNTIKDRITKRITNQILFIGGSCNRYEGNCTNSGQSTAPFKSVTSPVRKAYIVRACEEITSQDEAITTALSNVGLTVMSPANSTNIKTIYNLFFPGRSVSNEALDNLINQHQAAISLAQTQTDAWRFVLYTLCASPLMEML